MLQLIMYLWLLLSYSVYGYFLVCGQIDINTEKQFFIKHTEGAWGRHFPMSGGCSAKRLRGACPHRESVVSHQNNKRYLGDTTLDFSAQEAVSTVDFGPRKGWNIKGLVNVRPDGRIILTQDGEGLAWKYVELNVDEFPVMLVRVTNSLPRERWMIIVEKGDSPSFDKNQGICLADKFGEEGGHFIPFKKITGWSGKVKFVLMIFVEGHKGDCIEFDALEAVRFSTAKPSQPRLSVPINDSAISPMALHFIWFQAKDAMEYELQISKYSDFSEKRSLKFEPPYLTDKLLYLPEDEELLQPGKWFWRVRAFNIMGQPGDWSEMGTFSVKKARISPKPPVLSISNTYPLILLCSDDQHMVENWKSLPDEIRQHTVFRIEVLPTENLQKTLKKAQKNDIPVIFQASGPHDDYGRMSSRISLSEIEQIFLDFPVVKGVYICEQAFRVAPSRNRIMMDYAERLIRLAAEYGKVVLWADGHWGRNLWIDVGLNKKLMDTIQKYRQYFIPLWKMNCSLTPYSIHSSVFGFWISRAVDNWGVQPERWYWYEAGLGKLNQQFWFKEGKMEDFPPTFYDQMILLGLSSGASVYSFEPSSDTWTQEGNISEISRNVIFPLLSQIIRHHLIPGRAKILEKIKCVYVADDSDSSWSLDYETMNTIYKGMYGTEHPFKMIPSSSRYFFLPIISKWTSQEILKSFPDKFYANKFSSSEEAKSYLNKRYGSHYKGDAWVRKLEDAAIVMNSHENMDVDQSFEVPMKGKINRISGQIGVNSYMIAQEVKDGLWMQLNGREERSQTLNLWVQKKPQKVLITPESSLVESSWDDTDYRLTLKFLLNTRAINVKIEF